MPHLAGRALSYAAACTERLRLGCAVFVTPLHSPLHLAKSISSLDQLSRGRVEVGVGTGGGFRMFSAFGMDGQHFVSRFTEGLELMRAMWTRTGWISTGGSGRRMARRWNPSLSRNRTRRSGSVAATQRAAPRGAAGRRVHGRGLHGHR